ncbi:MAG: GIY-YIG nuclease family protein [Nitrosotalea sp.]
MTIKTPTQDVRIHYLYRITNTINGKIYIGQSVDTVRRWYEHKRQAIQDNSEMIISRAIKKYGSAVFEFEVIVSCKTWEDANDTETLLVQQFDCQTPKGYNIAAGGINAPKSEEWKEYMRQIKGGWIDREHSEENLEKNRQAHLGLKHSEETIEKQSVSMKKKIANGWMPITSFTKGSDAARVWQDKKFSEEHKKKISEGLKRAAQSKKSKLRVVQ